jgi:putative ABC transport system permease protein
VEFFDQVLSRLSSLPGVTGAATATFLPYIIANTNQDFSIEGRPWSSAAEARSANTEIISPNYFRLMGIPLIRGREFADQDAAGGPDVVVISQTLARHYWPNQDPIGHRIRPGHIDPWATIVGVVGDVTMNWSDPYPPYALYRPYRQVSYTYASMIVRSTMNPESLGPAVRSAVSAVDPDQPLYDVRSMSQVIRESTISITYAAVMMMALGVLALILAGLGVYGVLAFTVTQSTHEIGLRMALGALPGDVLRLIVGRGMLLAGFGLVAGIPVAYWLSRSLGAGYISGISTAGPVIFIEIALVVLSAALAASWFPARRATRTEPMAALRYE